jgi:16S rRNA (uracil1498-N3)-methyltransferase
MSKVRLYVEHPLGAGQCVPLTGPQAHYLFGVMRLGPGDGLALFNGRDGEWRARVAQAGKKGGALLCEAQTAPLRLPPDVWLMFAPLKKARTDFIVEKAAELGVRRILPVATDFTGAERARRDRLQAHAVEAAEQCGGTYVPEVAEMAPLAGVLEGWDPARRILWCDEARVGMAVALSGAPGPWAVLTGPEGGFSEAERARLAALPFVVPVSLGPRILRADTAAVAALALWQVHCGDWR